MGAAVFDGSIDRETFAEQLKKLVRTGSRVFVAQSIEHELASAIEQLKAFSHLLFARHPAGAFDLFAGAGVHDL
jgi:hypothetical protein